VLGTGEQLRVMAKRRLLTLARDAAGLKECILSGLFSVAGKKVLHM
jgi:hypothetical protein